MNSPKTQDVKERPTVWVLKEHVRSRMTGPEAMDYTPAYQYGDVRFVTDFDLPPHSKSTVSEGWHKAVGCFLKEYKPGRDFIILTGSPLSIFRLGQLLGKMDMVIFDEVAHQILVWRREQSAYFLTQLN